MKLIQYLTLTVILLLAANLAHGQGFFKPVDKGMFNVGERSPQGIWLIRPTVQLSAMQIMFGEVTEVRSLSSLGTGVSYAHFTSHDGEPYQDFAVDVSVLFGPEKKEAVSPLNLSLAISATGWQYLTIGAGYSLTVKKFFLLSGISYRFN